MADLQVLANTAKDGYTLGTYRAVPTLYQATAATGSYSWTAPYAGTLTGVFASALETQSSDRTDTITVAKWAPNGTSGTAMLGTSGVLSSGNAAAATRRTIGTTGLTAYTSNVNPVLSTTAATVAFAQGDTLVVTNTSAGSNGSAATVLNVTLEVKFNLGDGIGAP